MPEITRILAYKLVIDLTKHHRPHVHVELKGNRVASIEIETLVTIGDIDQPAKKRILAYIDTNKAELLSLWNNL